jgi:putative endonuclease
VATRQAVGREGEDEALLFFLGEGYTLTDRNWRCRYGEIDLIMEKAGTIHFIEVKARRSSFEHPLAAIRERKRMRMGRAIDLWFQRHPERATSPYQADAYCIWQEQGQKRTAWIEGI